MTRLVVATRNPAKIAAIGRWLPRHELRAAPHDISGETSETGSTVAANAVSKVETLSARLPGVLVVATDGGLLVPALGDRWDPLRTHRFAGPDASAANRARALLRLAGDLRGVDRAVGWREALAVAVDGRHELATTLHESLLGAAPAFWVPAIWRCPECGGKRLADLTPEEQATRLDHWMQLGAALGGWLAQVNAPMELHRNRPYRRLSTPVPRLGDR